MLLIKLILCLIIMLLIVRWNNLMNESRRRSMIVTEKLVKLIEMCVFCCCVYNVNVFVWFVILVVKEKLLNVIVLLIMKIMNDVLCYLLIIVVCNVRLFSFLNCMSSRCMKFLNCELNVFIFMMMWFFVLFDIFKNFCFWNVSFVVFVLSFCFFKLFNFIGIFGTFYV